MSLSFEAFVPDAAASASVCDALSSLYTTRVRQESLAALPAALLPLLVDPDFIYSASFFGFALRFASVDGRIAARCPR